LITKKKTVFVKTFGCQMNEYDTEKMLMLLSKDYDRVLEPDSADLVLVNTCSVREKGEHKLFGLLGRLRDLKSTNSQMIIGVGGCVAQQEGESIVKRNQAVDFVVGTHNISLVPSLISRVLDSRKRETFTPQIAIDYRDEWEELPDEFDAMPENSKIVSSAFNSRVRALVAIQRGCNKHCSFCVVPTTRGPQVSRSIDEILKEIRLKVRMGVKEVLLLGQTVNSYGLDLSPRIKFSELVKRVSDIDGIERIRFTSPHPAEIRTDFISLYKEIPKLCPQIHMPLQSGSNRILKAMNRNYKVERFLEIINELKSTLPEIAISTDIIVGFPTETESEFQETINVMNEVKFHACFSYKYSVRPNTKANEQYGTHDEISEKIKKDRITRLQIIQDEHSLEFNNRFLNQEVKIFSENYSDSGYSVRGRTDFNIPAEFILEKDMKMPEIGKLLSGKVLRATPHGLKALLLLDGKESDSLRTKNSQIGYYSSSPENSF
jgi:tRNA-2-methylthio-N6-dimethylallyladenosine synthase